MLGLCMYPKSAADSRRKYVQINSKHRYPERYPPDWPPSILHTRGDLLSKFPTPGRKKCVQVPPL